MRWVAQIVYKDEVFWKIVGETRQLENALILLQNEIYINQNKKEIIKVLVISLPDAVEIEE